MASNIGRKPVQIEAGVVVTIHDGRAVVAGPKGTLDAKIPAGIVIEQADNLIKVRKAYESRELEKYVGLVRALLANMVQGVTRGFEKNLKLNGVGYRARVEGTDLVLNVGFATPMRVQPISGVTFQVSENIITVSGINKQLIGDMASKIRAIRPPDAYKHKGIQYEGEKLRKKVGKAAKAVGGK